MQIVKEVSVWTSSYHHYHGHYHLNLHHLKNIPSRMQKDVSSQQQQQQLNRQKASHVMTYWNLLKCTHPFLLSNEMAGVFFSSFAILILLSISKVFCYNSDTIPYIPDDGTRHIQHGGSKAEIEV